MSGTGLADKHVRQPCELPRVKRIWVEWLRRFDSGEVTTLTEEEDESQEGERVEDVAHLELKQHKARVSWMRRTGEVMVAMLTRTRSSQRISAIGVAL